MSTLTRTADRPGERADAFLARVVPDLTRSAAQRLLEAGAVRLAGRPVRKNYRTAPGDVLEVDIPAPQPVDLVPQDIPLDIVYEDGDVIVVNKPVGMVVHPAPGHSDGTLVNALLYHCGNTLSGINGTLRPGIVHRIDRDTSGLIIAAKNDVPSDTVGEISDLIYHLMVMMVERNIPLEDVLDELDRRSRKIGNLKQMKQVDKET